MQLIQSKKYNFTLYLNYTAVVYAFIIPLSRAGIGILTAMMILLWLLEGGFKDKLNLYRKNKVIIFLILFLLLGFVSLLWTEDQQVSLYLQRRYWYLFPLFIFMTSLQKEFIPKLLSAFILGMFVSEVIAYGVFFELWSFMNATVANPSPFMHHIIYSIFLAFTALLLLNYIFNFHTLKYKIMYAFFFVTVTGNLFLTNGRTGQLAFLVGLFTLALLSFKHKLKAFLMTILLGGVVFVVAFNISTTFKQRVLLGKSDLTQVIEKKNYCSSWGGRVGAWIVSQDIIKEDPLLGVGIQDNMKLFHEIIDEKHPSMKCMHHSFMHTHNQYLQIWTSLGFLGLFLFLAMFYALVRLPIKNKELHHIKYIYISILLFSFMPEVIWGRQFSLALTALVFGILLAQNRVENESSSRESKTLA
ncbi:MAG TPA: O-antigen ligase domain-containing protein [Sulfurovum sp.]|nr:O-antigen ligase domain-containing protein [Sulfurovum sp.]